MAQKPAVFDGDFVRILKNGLKLTNGIKITGDAIDPTETAVDGELGDIFISSIAPGGMYQKTDSGVTTNWNLIAASVSGVNTVAGRAGDVVLSKSDISGIDQVDNTSDLNKPVSTATQTALDLKADSSALASYQPLDTDLTVISGLTPSNDDVLQRKAGSWINRTIAQLKSDLAYTIDSLLPSQTGNSGKFLTTNGSVSSWATASGALVQVKNTQDATVSSLTATIPVDNSKPQSGEGTQVMALSITPTSATNKLLITVVYNFSPNGNYQSICALFQDSTADALCASAARALSGANGVITLKYYMTAGTTSPTTFKVRAGPQVGGGTDTYNGVSGASILGSVSYSSMTIEELVP